MIDRAFSSQMPRTSDFIKGRFRTGPWYGLNLTIGLVSLLLAILSFGEIVDALTDQETLFYLDFRIQRIVERITTPSLTRWMVDITNYGGIYLTAGVALFLFIFLLKRRNGWDLLSLFLAAGVGGVILGLMKLLFHRSRPIPQEINTKGFGFPSGHAFMAITVYGFLVYITWKEAKNTAIRLTVTAFAFLVILLVGFSRIYLNVHWLTDVLGGYAAGATMLIIAILIINTLKSAI
ncbi:phosphatase PAP2 family protein [Candidatus Manganitrophus noduliformans]|uniref:phosphatase PAP2 family protein n=1 Tax=Candidatus Manganitrophus noduliformans TaxID=2606439 RepID=UPI001EE2BD95|nr:phosphatase PAP2 family protein [Candidatus Manganitrophus noduliformans]